MMLTNSMIAALADGNNRAVNAIQILNMQIGTGVGAPDPARTALRSLSFELPAVGTTITEGHIALRADFSPPTRDFFEVGITARIGLDGAPFLAAYHSSADAQVPLARGLQGATLPIISEIVFTAAAAAVTVTPTVHVSVGVRTFAALDDTPASLSGMGGQHLAVNDTGNGIVGTPAPPPLPVGCMMPYAGTGAAPNGWLLCDGTAVSRTLYAPLYAVIGNTYGPGDGATTFNVPDLRRRVVAGAGGVGTDQLGNTVGSRGGAEDVTLTTAQMPAHEHDDGDLATAAAGSHTHDAGTYKADSAGSHTHGIPLNTGGFTPGPNADPNYNASGPPDSTGSTASAGSHAHDVSGRSSPAGSHAHSVSGDTGSTGGGQAHPNLPPTLIAQYLIKT